MSHNMILSRAQPSWFRNRQHHLFTSIGLRDFQPVGLPLM